MSRKTISYFDSKVFVGPNWDGEEPYIDSAIRPLSRVQSCSISVQMNQEESEKMGSLEINEVNNSVPNVFIKIEYFFTNGYNEAVLGFFLDEKINNPAAPFEENSCLANCFNKSGRDFFILTNKNEGQMTTVVSDATIKNYTLQSAAGELTKVSVEFEAANVHVEEGIGECSLSRLDKFGDEYGHISVALPSFSLPSSYINFEDELVNSEPVAIVGGGIDVEFFSEDGKVPILGANDVNISFLNISIAFSRNEVFSIGQKTSSLNYRNYFAETSIDFESIVGAEASESLAAFKCSKRVGVKIGFRPACAETPFFQILSTGLKVDDISVIQSIDKRKTVGMMFSARYPGKNFLEKEFSFSSMQVKML